VTRVNGVLRRNMPVGEQIGAVSERTQLVEASTSLREGTLVAFQVWDLTRMERIHDAMSVRDDLVVDLTLLPGGGLKALPATNGEGDYEAYLAVIPGDALAEIYTRHGSRLLEGNVRTFLGRRGNINRGIQRTLEKEPSRFFAYNNGIAATASAIECREDELGGIHITSAPICRLSTGPKPRRPSPQHFGRRGCREVAYSYR
jgi:hypothetical protein